MTRPTDSTAALQTAAGLLALLRLPGVGPAKALAYANGEMPLGDLDESALTEAQLEADAQVDDYQGADVRALGFFDEDFPASLRTIRSAPAVLFVRGSVAAWRSPALAVVGTRSPTSFGDKMTTKLTTAASEAGHTVISGLAVGIDAIAHHAALAAGGPTTAVLGSGLDSIAPRQHRELGDQILQQGGALVSEQPFATRASGRTLVARNRLQTGLADAVLVGQTGIEGGTLHTVRFAAEQGKPVYCPVPDDAAPESAGLVALLDTPAHQLPDVLPAWGRARRLADRLGDQPLARAVNEEDIAGWLAELSTRRSQSHEWTPASGDGDQLSLEDF